MCYESNRETFRHVLAIFACDTLQKVTEMKSFPSEFEHGARALAAIAQTLQSLGADAAILKVLPKNANDKNQVYFGADFGSLHATFDLTLAERGDSTSETKVRSGPGRKISEAVFNDFSWVKRDLSAVAAKNVKAIVYPQYPEARLSGFQTVENTMPRSLSVEFTKEFPDATRLLVLGRKPGGACVAMMYVNLSPELTAEIAALPGLENSRVCKLLTLDQESSAKLFARLSAVVSRAIRGCRLNAFGKTLPFMGTQVCGYTLEHELGIVPNSGKDGDLYGIELKTHMQVKVTLFTPEPDFGFYAADFEGFMRRFGYDSGEGEFRLTGVHRAKKRCAKSGLTLMVREYRQQELEKGRPDWIRQADGNRKPFPYDPSTSLTSKMDAVEVVLVDDAGFVAAGWSLERLMNNWGVKHNEVVFLSAERSVNENPDEVAQGYGWQVTFSPTVIWCRKTSAERMLRAIDDGVIFLDPAPKFVPANPSENKRRAQWRVNDISKAVHSLYEHVEIRHVDANPAASPVAAESGPVPPHQQGSLWAMAQLPGADSVVA